MGNGARGERATGERATGERAKVSGEERWNAAGGPPRRLCRHALTVGRTNGRRQRRELVVRHEDACEMGRTGGVSAWVRRDNVAPIP